MEFFSRNHARPNIAISVGTRTISALIFELQENKDAPRGIKKVVMRLHAPYTSARTVKALHELIFSLLKEIERIPEKIIIGVGPEIAESKWERWEVESLHSKEPLTKSHLQKYLHDFFDTYRDKNRAVLCYPISLEANGYPVDADTLARQDASLIKELAIHAITVTFPDDIGALFGELQKMFGGITIELVPHVVAIAETFAKTLAIHDAFLADIGDTLTTLIFIQQGRLAQFVSFPLGADAITRRLMKIKGISFIQADDLKRQYIQDIVPPDERQKISQAIIQEIEEWKRQCVNGFEYFYNIGPIPQNFFLFGEGASLPEIRTSLALNELAKKFSYVESFTVQILQGSAIYKGDSLHGMIQGPEDVRIASLAHYALHHKPLF